MNVFSLKQFRRKEFKVIKTTRYCDICGKEIRDKFYQLILPEYNNYGEIILPENKSDLCKTCFRELFWKISDLKYPDGKCPF